MQADIDMLHRRRSDLEDEELEMMEQRETLDADRHPTPPSARCRRPSRELRGHDHRRPKPRSTTRSCVSRRQARRLAKPIAESLLRDDERRRIQNRGAGEAGG